MVLSAPDPGGLPPLMWFTVTTVLLFWAVTRPRLVRQALRVVVSGPAFLVPAAMLVAAMGLFVSAGHGLSDNPFDQGLHRLGSGFGWVGLALSSVAVAGLIGLLEAWDDGRKPGSDAFRVGIRKHVSTIFGAKLLVAGALTLLLGWIGGSPVLLIVCLLPSLLLAPAIGASSLHPNRPWEALVETFRIVRRQMWFVGRVITAQAVSWIGLLLLGQYAVEGQAPDLSSARFAEDLSGLAGGFSALGFNFFDMVSPDQPSSTIVFTALAVIATAFGSTVFITAHWIGATSSYVPRPRSGREDKLAGEQKAEA